MPKDPCLESPEAINAEVNRLLEERGGGLSAWLMDQGLSINDVRPKPSWGAVRKRLEKRGVWDGANGWLTDSRDELLRRRVTEHRRIAMQLAMRFLVVRVEKSAEEFLREKKKLAVDGDDGSLRYLPEDLQWLYGHPGLGTDSEDKLVVATFTAYERKNPPPNNGAVSQYQLYKTQPKERAAFFKRCQDTMIDARKTENKRMAQDSEDAGVVKERARVLDMKAELAKMKAGVTTS